MTWNADVAFGPPTPKKIRTVSPTLAFIGCSAVSAPTAPLKTKYSARSASSFSTLNSSWPRCPYVDHRVGALPGSQLRALRLANKLRLDLQDLDSMIENAKAERTGSVDRSPSAPGAAQL